MRLGAKIARGFWVSIPFTIMGFMTGGYIIALLLFFVSLFLLPAFIADFMKEETGKTFLKVSGYGYLLVGLYGLIFESAKQYSCWYFISMISLIICVGYFVVGYDLFEKKQNIKTIKTNINNNSLIPKRMTPRYFEQLVADYYQSKGYETEVTPYAGDYGVDVIARKGDEKIAVQAKMYGNSTRKVNRETVMQLYGAMAYRQCTKAVIATDGRCMPDAIEVANSLGIETLYFDTSKQVVRVKNEETYTEEQLGRELSDNMMAFDEMWKNYIMPLSGKTISNGSLTNKILSVDWGGLRRITSNNKTSRISIEEFRYAYNQLVLNGSVERELINQHTKRCSSGIILVLSQLPFIGVQDRPKKMLYLKK